MKKGWETKKLGEICQFINGRAYNKQELLNEGKYTVLRVGNFFTSDHWYYSDLELEENKYCDNGDLLYAWSASFGPKIWNGGKVIYHYHIWKVIPNESLVTKEYLYHLLDWDKDQIKIDQGAGTTMTHVSKGSMEERLVNIPSLAEQQRIVSVLDEAFASIAQAKSNAERNLVNARELFDSYVGNIFAKSSEEWEEKKLGDKSIIEIIDNDRGVNYPKKSDFHPEGYCLFMNTKNVRPDGFDFTTTMFITEKKDKALGKGKLSRNDVVMTTRGTIGNLGVYNDEVPFEQIRTNSGMLIFRPNLKYIVPEYLFEILRSGIIKSQITKHVSGAAQPQLPIKTLVNFTFPLPKSLAEQRAIVGRLEALSAETGRLEEIYQQKVESLEELKKSVLGKAFAGEL